MARAVRPVRVCSASPEIRGGEHLSGGFMMETTDVRGCEIGEPQRFFNERS